MGLDLVRAVAFIVGRLELQSFHVVVLVALKCAGTRLLSSIDAVADGCAANSELYRNVIDLVEKLTEFFVEPLLVQMDFLIIATDMRPIFLHFHNGCEIEYHIEMRHPLFISRELLGTPLETIS